jgi:hypothetical protein
VLFDFDHYMPDHAQHAITVIGMLVPTSKYSLNDETAPIHLQGLESLFLLVGWLNTLTAKGFVVIHDHRINAQIGDLLAGNLQTPEKKMVQKPAEQKHTRPGKGLEKPFDLMRIGHARLIWLDAAGITLTLGKLIEMGQSTTGAIDEKAQHLLEKLYIGQAFAVFTNGTEPAIEPVEHFNAVQIRHEQGQTRTAGQPVSGGFDTSNFKFILPVIFALSARRVLYILGVWFLVSPLARINKCYITLSNFKGLFFFNNRSHWV